MKLGNHVVLVRNVTAQFLCQVAVSLQRIMIMLKVSNYKTRQPSYY